MKLYKVFSSFLAVVFVTLGLTVPVYSVNANPASGEIAPGATQVLTLVAAPPAPGQVAVEIQLSASNMTITNYTAPSGGNWGTPLGLCAGGARYTSNSVCVALAKNSGTIASGESLGTITVTFGSVGTATLTRTAENKYSDLDEETVQTGIAGIYTVQEGAADELPNTAIDFSNSKSLILGALVLILGTFLTIKVVFFVLPNRRFRLRVEK